MGRRRTVDVQALVEAAARVFERHGYAEATLDDIATEAGVSKPTIYQYVKSKQRLLEIIVEQVIYPLRTGITAIIDSPDDPAAKLHAYIRLHVDAACRYTVYYQVLMADQHQLSAQGLRDYQSWARGINRSAADLLEQGIAEGVVRDDIHVATAAKLLNSTLTSIARWYRPSRRLTPDDIYAETLKMLTGVLTAPDNGGPDGPNLHHVGAPVIAGC